MRTYKSLPPGSSFRVCRKLIRDMMKVAWSYSVSPDDRAIAHCHLDTPITGLVLSDEWLLLDSLHANITKVCLDGFTQDEVSGKVYWDRDGAIGESLTAMFWGSAGLQVTSTIPAPVTLTISMGLFVDGNLILETPITFEKKEQIQTFAANDVLVDAQYKDLLQPGSYFQFFIKAGTGETPTVTIDYLQTTIKKD